MGLPPVSDLTLEEKASLVLGSTFWRTRGIPRLGIPELLLSDGPHGLRVQAANVGDHVGLGGSLPATCFPTASALGSSWDPELAATVASAIGREAVALDVAVALGPGVNIKRSPLCGRNFEYLSEDPVLTGVLGAAFVNALQAEGVGASVKHYALNNQETDRLLVSSDVSERAMREIYFPGFERIVKESAPWTVMCSYNRVNGVHVSQNHWLLTEVLRDQWGFDGLVVSDWGAVHDRVAALAAGLDLEMPPNLGHSDKAVIAAVQSGELDEAVLDRAVQRLLTLIERVSHRSKTDGKLDLDAHHALARRVAQDCAVLLKNDNGVLPLAVGRGAKVAVIGEFARTPRFQGAGSSQVNATQVDNALDTLRSSLESRGAEVAFAPGYVTDGAADDVSLVPEAVQSASAADIVLVFLGLPSDAESEGFDRTHIDLPQNQLALIDQIGAVADRVVVVLSNGSAVRVTPWEHHATAILEAWLTGQAGGSAIADLLLGDASPSGRLAETIPLRLEDNSSYLNFPGDSGHVLYGEGIFVGYRGYDAQHHEVAYPFGFGLTYTTFEYSDPTVEVDGSQADGTLRVRVTCAVTNTGARRGKEVVQLYVNDVESSVARPVRELKAFSKTDVEPGQTRTVSFELDERAFSFWSEQYDRWLLEPGDFVLEIGASSRDIRLTLPVQLDATVPPRPITGLTTLQDFLADAQASELLWEALRGPDGAIRSAMTDKHWVNLVGSFPIRSLAAFAKSGLNHQIVDDLLERLADRR